MWFHVEFFKSIRILQRNESWCWSQVHFESDSEWFGKCCSFAMALEIVWNMRLCVRFVASVTASGFGNGRELIAENNTCHVKHKQNYWFQQVQVHEYMLSVIIERDFAILFSILIKWHRFEMLAHESKMKYTPKATHPRFCVFMKILINQMHRKHFNVTNEKAVLVFIDSNFPIKYLNLVAAFVCFLLGVVLFVGFVKEKCLESCNHN